MPPIPSDARLDKAILQSVKDGTYPEDEEALSAALPSSALGSLEKLLHEARTEVEASIRELSRLSAADVDGWIAQAKQLRAGIEGSQSQADAIVALGQEASTLAASEEDAAGKVAFLEDELAFYDTLAATTGQIQSLSNSLDAAQKAVSDDQILDAIGFLKKVDVDLQDLRENQNAAIGGILADRAAELRELVVATLTKHWSTMIRTNRPNSKVTLDLPLDDATLGLEAVIRGLHAVGLLKDRTVSLGKTYTNVMLAPYIRQDLTRPRSTFTISDNTIQLLENSEPSSGDFLSDLANAIRFPIERLPRSISKPIGELIILATTSHLLSDYLPNLVPSDLGGIPAFQAELTRVADFASSLEALVPQTGRPLTDWVSSAPSLWLTRRSGSALGSIRQLLKRGLGSLRAVERVETQVISSEDDVFGAAGPDSADDDDWNAAWDENPEDEDGDDVRASVSESGNGHGPDQAEDDNWDFDGGEPGQEKQEGPEEDDEAGDAWGWGEDEEPGAKAPAKPASSAPTPAAAAQTNGRSKKQPAKARPGKTVTLRETYHITAVPEQILEIVIMAIEDAEALSKSHPPSPVAPAAPSLAALPEALLALYRALAPSFYGHDANAHMLLYNDSLYLAEQLRAFAAAPHPRRLDTAALPEAAAQVEAGGKRAYAREMEAQRTVLRDLLDGAQAFANCAEPPFAEQCRLAIDAVCDRLRALHGQWAPVLARSARLQSLGALLGTVTGKIVVDIEDLDDISEAESQRLVELCNRVLELDALFLPERAAGAEGAGEAEEPAVPLTAGYAPGWLKFQYLVNVLESSLVDIKFLWTEGELSLEFGAEEVVDLVEALFADSEHRRRAVAEIRRGARPA